jgi:hypothetical protein
VATPLVAPPTAPVPAAPAIFAAPTDPPAVPAPSARVPIARRWWFWAGLGAAAVSVVVAGILLAPRDPYTGNASPGITQVF